MAMGQKRQRPLGLRKRQTEDLGLQLATDTLDMLMQDVQDVFQKSDIGSAI
jgi:hypothetical protein